jgi:transcriptional repressor NF-X1
MEAQMVDREPHRSVQLIRRIDTRVPANLLSQTSATGSTLGKLADLRAPGRVSPAPAPASSGPPRANRGWNTVLTTPHGGNPLLAAQSANSLPTRRASPIGSERISRPTTPSQSLTQPVAAAAAATAVPSSDAVPDDWEDDS